MNPRPGRLFPLAQLQSWLVRKVNLGAFRRRFEVAPAGHPAASVQTRMMLHHRCSPARCRLSRMAPAPGAADAGAGIESSCLVARSSVQAPRDIEEVEVEDDGIASPRGKWGLKGSCWKTGWQAVPSGTTVCCYIMATWLH